MYVLYYIYIQYLYLYKCTPEGPVAPPVISSALRLEVFELPLRWRAGAGSAQLVPDDGVQLPGGHVGHVGHVGPIATAKNISVRCPR